MKLLFVCLSLGFAANAVAAETYFSPGWPGEGGLNFVVKKETTVPARRAPEAKTAASEQCTLAEGAKYGPQQANPAAELYTRTEVQHFRAAKDLALEEYDEAGNVKNVPVKKGAPIEELAYLGEGICLIRVAGRALESSCPSLVQSGEYQAEGKPSDGPVFEEWLNLSCQGAATRLWILAEELRPLLDGKALEELPFEG